MGVQNFYLAHGFKPWAIHPSINIILPSGMALRRFFGILKKLASFFDPGF
jgi:hypothetical protein